MCYADVPLGGWPDKHAMMITTTRPQHPISIRLTKKELDRLDQLAKDRGTTRHDLLRQVVRRLVKLPTTEDVLHAVDYQDDNARIAAYKADLIKRGL